MLIYPVQDGYSQQIIQTDTNERYFRPELQFSDFDYKVHINNERLESLATFLISSSLGYWQSTKRKEKSLYFQDIIELVRVLLCTEIWAQALLYHVT